MKEIPKKARKKKTKLDIEILPFPESYINKKVMLYDHLANQTVTGVIKNFDYLVEQFEVIANTSYGPQSFHFAMEDIGYAVHILENPTDIFMEILDAP